MRLSSLAFSIALCVPAAVFAQAGTEGSFFGTVTDSAGAVVPVAGVTVTNLNTGLTKTVLTNEEGGFNILALPVGSYSIAVSAKGFKKWELARVELNVGDRNRIVPVLEVGQVSETVFVTATAEVLQTEKSSLQMIVQMEQIRELPLVTRNPLALVALAPGMRYESTQPGGERATYVQGQGQRNNKAGFQLDGLNSNAPMDEGGTGIPNVDMIAEFNVETLNFGAQNGRNPMLVSVVTKSGTNSFHGTLWEYLQNDAFNARNTFATSVTKVRRNQYGAAAGGPVIRNKTFFFANYERTEIHNSQLYNSLAVTPAMEAGNFSSFTKIIRNPFNAGAPFPGNQIPQSMFSRASVYFLPWILEPNSPDGFFKGSAPAPNDTYEGTIRVDHDLTRSQRIYGRYVTVHQPRLVPGYRPDQVGNDEVIQNNVGVNYNWTISSKLLFSASGGTLHTTERYGNPLLGKQNDSALAGIQGLPTLGREAWIGPPDINLGSGYTGVSFSGGFGGPGGLWGTVYNFKTGLSYLAGSHTIEAGFEYGDWRTYASHGSSAGRGVFNFTNLYTNDGFADFLLGLTSGSQRNDPETFGNDRAPYTGSYINDHWRVRNNFSLELGLRYDRWLAHHALNELATAWDPDIRKIVLEVNSAGKPNLTQYPVTPFLAAATKGLWVTAPEAGYPNGLYVANGNWAPRLGMVYRPSFGKNLVLRANFGIFYNSFTGNRGASVNNAPHWAQETKTISLTTLQPWETIWPVDPTSFSALGVHSPRVNIRPARTNEWNVTVQTALPLKSALTVSYVGTRVGNEIGQNQSYNEATIGPHASIDADRPLAPLLGQIYLIENLGKFWYHSLQTKLERRFSRGIAFTFSYSYSRSMLDKVSDGETSVPVPFAPDWYLRGRTNFDFRHIEYATVVWELPFGPGRTYFTHMNRATEALFGGWEVAATQQGQSGQPLNITNGTNNLGNGWGTRANIVGDPGLANPSTAKWFNTAAFAPAPLYTFGNAGLGIIEGPGTFAINTSLSKRFYIKEQKSLQFRWETFNTTNRVNYSNPTTALTSTSYGAITSAGAPRSMQLALKAIF